MPITQHILYKIFTKQFFFDKIVDLQLMHFISYARQCKQSVHGQASTNDPFSVFYKGKMRAF